MASSDCVSFSVKQEKIDSISWCLFFLRNLFSRLATVQAQLTALSFFVKFTVLVHLNPVWHQPSLLFHFLSMKIMARTLDIHSGCNENIFFSTHWWILHRWALQNQWICSLFSCCSQSLVGQIGYCIWFTAAIWLSGAIYTLRFLHHWSIRRVQQEQLQK